MKDQNTNNWKIGDKVLTSAGKGTIYELDVIMGGYLFTKVKLDRGGSWAGESHKLERLPR